VLTELGHLPWSLFWQIVMLLVLMMIVIAAIKSS
jgi:hypothetical protein